MIFKSEHITQASGSVGGVTYSRAKGGTLYRRARAIPVNPNTEMQQQVRSAVTGLVNYWSEMLTPTQRETWEMYAANVPVTNKLGSTVNLTGQNWFVGANTPRLQALAKLTAATPQVDSGPSLFDRGAFTTPTSLTAVEGVDIAFTIDNSDDWANEDDSAMLVYVSMPQNAGVLNYHKSWRLVDVIEGDSVTPPANGVTITTAELTAEGFGPVVAGSNYWIQVAVTRADGRLSTRRQLGPVLAT
jgi:hypothetical protein